MHCGPDNRRVSLVGRVDPMKGNKDFIDAAGLHHAIDDQLTCIFVDNSLLRLNEGDEATATFTKYLGVQVIRINSETRFLHTLSDVADPEQKRKIIAPDICRFFPR